MELLNFRNALRQAIIEEMEEDKDIVLLGEDIAEYGGAFKVTEGLLEMFGEDRVCNTPISEIAIIGAATGAAITGLRPIAEIQFCDFLTCTMDQICNQAAKASLMSGGNINVPITIRTPIGSTGRGAQHSQCLEAWFMHNPGIKVVIPSTPLDAKGLLKSAIRDDNPVMIFEHKWLYSIDIKDDPEFPDLTRVMRPANKEDGYIPLGKADVKREGRDITVIATSFMVYKALKAAAYLARDNIEIEVVDPRTLVPLDKDTILESVKKTSRAIIVSEDVQTCGVTSEISAVIAEEAMDYLDAPIKRLSVPDTPIPFAPNNENTAIPQESHIIEAVKDILR
jgi:pyruvate dehydrogenase E1 component beta subunit